jgi:hypothetical protein
MQLDRQLPDDLCVLGGVEVLVSENPLTVRVPDVIVVDRTLVDADPDRAPITEVRLVAEITVPGTARSDRSRSSPNTPRQACRSTGSSILTDRRWSRCSPSKTAGTATTVSAPARPP